MAAQRGVWQPGMQGPSAPWRRPDGADGGYIAADPGLHAAMDLLYTVPTGRSILTRLSRTTPALLLGETERGLGGYATPIGYYAVMSRAAMSDDQRAMATVIAHEGTHLVDFVSIALHLANFNCFEQEQRAHGVQAQVWSEFFGPGGKPDAREGWERFHNDVLRFAQRGDLENYVRRSAAYERQCVRERLSG
jgi:hypothetical protein